ncbi:MAG: hypothetical protein KDB01_13575 [Planctomycetaceae bacterium]|nr:hypothetical protein [Planctomycetaceae bacterium]
MFRISKLLSGFIVELLGVGGLLCALSASTAPAWQATSSPTRDAVPDSVGQEQRLPTAQDRAANGNVANGDVANGEAVTAVPSAVNPPENPDPQLVNDRIRYTEQRLDFYARRFGRLAQQQALREVGRLHPTTTAE